jgi:LPXTG-motif cell wall-anchored protein
MTLRNLFTAGICLTLFCLLAIPVSLLADEDNQATKMTFNEPVEIPGHVLAAGTYWFTLIDDTADRNIVQIWNGDRSHLVATVFAISDYRFKPTGKTVINFAERAADQPEAIEAWFYPGENYGHAFVYPKTRASVLAVQAKKPVLSMPDETATDAVPPPSPAMNAVSPSGDPVELSEIVQSEMPADQVEQRLPQTASVLPLFGVLGFGAIGAGLFLRRKQSKIA